MRCYVFHFLELHGKETILYALFCRMLSHSALYWWFIHACCRTQSFPPRMEFQCMNIWQYMQATVDGHLCCFQQIAHTDPAIGGRSCLRTLVYRCRCFQGACPELDGGSSGSENIQLYKTMTSCLPKWQWPGCTPSAGVWVPVASQPLSVFGGFVEFFSSCQSDRHCVFSDYWGLLSMWIFTLLRSAWT